MGQEPLEEAGQCFPDVASGVWFYSYVCYANRVSIIGGYPDGTFKPADNINFAEAAKIIAIAYEYESEADPEVWYKLFVEAIGSRNAIPMSITAFDQKITRGEMAEIIHRLKANITDQPSQSYMLLQGTPAEDGVVQKEVGVSARVAPNGQNGGDDEESAVVREVGVSARVL